MRPSRFSLCAALAIALAAGPAIAAPKPAPGIASQRTVNTVMGPVQELVLANGLKVLFSLLINGIAAVYFLGIGAASLPYGAFMAVCALAGDWVGAHLAQRLPARVFRGLVIAYGVIVAGKLLAS